MKSAIRLVLVLVLVGGIGFVVYHFAFGPSVTRACRHMVDLCDAQDVERCERALSKLAEVGGPTSEERAVSCMLEAKSCAAAAGCMAGAGAGALGEFFKGLNQALQDK